MRTFSNYMGDIVDLSEDLGPMATEEDKRIFVSGMQQQILDALAAELGSDFVDAFVSEAQRGGGTVSDLEGEDLVNAILAGEG